MSRQYTTASEYHLSDMPPNLLPAGTSANPQRGPDPGASRPGTRSGPRDGPTGGLTRTLGTVPVCGASSGPVASGTADRSG
ncbi:hypothetical protein Vwe01_39010 [Micromonospora andamanensis]|nr:hypothetical protein Vwe01_39010 [Micromonospora andamanensis]